MSLLAVWLSTFGFSFLSAIIPVLTVEVYLLGASALAPPSFILPLVIAAAGGQMAGKVLLYYTGTGALKIPGKRLQAALVKANTKMAENPRMGGALLFASASLGVPPFYVMTLAAGAARMNLPAFIVLGFVGRAIRFAAFVLAPQFAKGDVKLH